MSRSAADASSSAPSNPTDEQRPQSSPPRLPLPNSPSRHTFFTDPQAIRAPPSSIIASHQPPTAAASSSSMDYSRETASAPSSDPDFARRRRKRGAERSSPSGSSSQGDMADTEMEGGPSKAPASSSAPEGPPPKKKRTRTLTTPHQAAVLHALLAQSRFPTTQMREEVGRAIGLSARKVQIWFQNQRQKARRPRGQASTTSAPLTRPPQFGPFTNVPPGSASDVSPTAMTAGPSGQGLFSRGPASMSNMPHRGSAPSSASSERFAHTYHDPYLTEEYARPGMPPVQLAGPGIPGPSRRSQIDDPAWRARSQGFTSRPSATAPNPARPVGEQGPELTLTLPPVITNVPRARGPASSPFTPMSAGTYHSLASIRSLEASTSAHRSAYDNPRLALPPPNIDFSSTPRRPTLNIPPPFTLQPRPQWEDPAFSPFSRRRSPPALPHGIAPPFGSSPTSAQSQHAPFLHRGESLPSISTVVPMAPPAGSVLSPTDICSPLSPTTRARFDPIRSTARRVSSEHPARPGSDHDSKDDQLLSNR